MFDELDEQYRYCVYCKADCWLEPENQIHGKECPINTGLFPIDKMMLVTNACCMYCPYIFSEGDLYMLVNETNDVVCIGCATAINILGAKYE